MMRRVLVFLLTLPMLVPPGTCICQFQLSFFAKAVGEEASEDEVACCACSKCCPKKAEPGRSEKDSERTPEPEHAPGCPASPSHAVRLASSVQTKVDLFELLTASLPVESSPSSHVVSPEPGAVVSVAKPPGPESIFLVVCNFRC